MPSPTLFVANAASRFDAHRTLTDLATVQSLQNFVLAFEQWIARLAPPFANPAAAVAALR
jgi:chromate reductase